MKPVEDQLSIIQRGAVSIIEESELREKLSRGIPLRVKLGVDPTASDLHLGFTVILRKLRQFQDLGHQAVLIIGSYTAQVGDPSGRDKTRPQLSEEIVLENAETYLRQAAKILDLDSLEVRYNGDWFSSMTFIEVIHLLSRTTVARTLEREDFSSRYTAGTPIYLHEVVYPLMQGYDSVAINADIELGGTDQTFNLMVGRDLQRENGQEPQVCITMPLLEGLDGVRKMSKSYDNYVGIAEEPKEMFGKLMSISDDLMWKYYELLTDIPLDELASLKQGIENGTLHPMDIKKRLAEEIISFYHDTDAAGNARKEFEQVFSNRELPSDIPEYTLQDKTAGDLDVISLICDAGLVPSKSEARRMIQQGGVSIDNAKISSFSIPMPEQEQFVVKVGKRKFLKVNK
jgi:tyrosyl-tRNA synthetase